MEALTREEPWAEEPWTGLKTAQSTESARPGEGLGENLERVQGQLGFLNCDSVAGDGSSKVENTGRGAGSQGTRGNLERQIHLARKLRYLCTTWGQVDVLI